MRLFLVLAFILPMLLVAQPRGNPEPHRTWQSANRALEREDYAQALRLYRQLLDYSEQTDNRLGRVNALEAMALAYKKQDRPAQARLYARRAIDTGSPTYRAYYLLAQIAYERDRDASQAIRYCKDGLKRFPNNGDLLFYLDLLTRESGAPARTENRAYLPTTTMSPRAASVPAPYLSTMEREIVAEMNLARTRPAEYARYLEELARHYQGDLLKLPGKVPVRTQEGVSAVREAIRFLKAVAPVGALRPSAGMSRAASDHVRDQEKSGKTGHMGGDGSQPYERIERYGAWEGLSGENIAYGDDSARMFVMQLIIDDGVPNRGHRENMFNPEFRVAGVAIGTHPVYRSMCVITYASGYSERP